MAPAQSFLITILLWESSNPIKKMAEKNIVISVGEAKMIPFQEERN